VVSETREVPIGSFEVSAGGPTQVFTMDASALTEVGVSELDVDAGADITLSGLDDIDVTEKSGVSVAESSDPPHEAATTASDPMSASLTDDDKAASTEIDFRRSSQRRCMSALRRHFGEATHVPRK